MGESGAVVLPSMRKSLLDNVIHEVDLGDIDIAESERLFRVRPVKAAGVAKLKAAMTKLKKKTGVAFENCPVYLCQPLGLEYVVVSFRVI